MPAARTFDERVNRNGPIVARVGTPCWLWTGWINKGSGYGLLRLPNHRSAIMAHRYAWERANGPVPRGLWVLHKCDIRTCVNPDHLFLGDHQANMNDMYAKGRGRKARGEEQHLAKLTENAVRAIRRERAQTPPTPLKELAARYGVSLVAVSWAANGKTWKHVK